jgi:hypothetical protein
VTCPCCRNRFRNARRFDAHPCVSKDRHDAPSQKARSLQTQLRQTARIELARLMPYNKGTFGIETTTGGRTSVCDQSLQPAARNAPVTTEDATVADNAAETATTGMALLTDLFLALYKSWPYSSRSRSCGRIGQTQHPQFHIRRSEYFTIPERNAPITKPIGLELPSSDTISDNGRTGPRIGQSIFRHECYW